MATLEQLVIEFAADFSQFDAALNQASQKARVKAKELEQSVISPRVNLNSLHELNRLLDVKQRHIQQTARVFQQNPLRPMVDTSEIKRATAEVENFKRSFGSMTGVKAEGKATIRVEHEYKVSVRESNQDIARSIGGLSKDLKAVESATRSSGFSAGKLALGNILSGGFQSLTGGFFAGVGNILKLKTAEYIGSAELLGEKITEAFISAVEDEVAVAGKEFKDLAGMLGFGALGDEIISSIKDLKAALDKELESLLGERKAMVQGQVVEQRAQSMRRETQQGQRGTLTIARQDRRNAEQAYQQAENSLSRLRQHEKMFERVSALYENYDYEAQAKQIQAVEAKIAETRQNLEQSTDPQMVEVLGKELLSLTQELTGIVAEPGMLAEFLENYYEVQEKLTEEYEKAKRRVERLGKKAGKSLQTFQAQMPIPQATVIQESLKAVFGDTTQGLPEIIGAEAKDVGDGTAKGVYDYLTNQIKLRKEIFQRLQDGSFTDEDVHVLVHELRHAQQNQMGSFDGIRQAKSGNVKGLSTPSNAQELADIASFANLYLDRPDILGDNPDAFLALEIDAEMVARRKASDVAKRARAKGAINEFQGAAGYGGSKIPDAMGAAQVKAASAKIEYLKEVMQSMGMQASEMLSRYGELFKAHDKSIADIQSVVAGVYTGEGSAEDLAAIVKIVDKRGQDIAQTLALFDKFQSDLLAEIGAQKVSFRKIAGYRQSIADLTQQVDSAANTGDAKGLRIARKQIDSQLRSLSKEDGIKDNEALKSLRTEFQALKKQARLDYGLALKTDGGGLNIRDIPGSIQSMVDKKIMDIQDGATEMVHAVFDPIIDGAKHLASNPVAALGAGGGLALRGANAGIRGIAPAVSAGYGMLQGAENVALSVLPYGHLAKKGLQVGAVVAGLPMAAAAIPALAPVGGMLGAAGHLGGSLASGAAAGQLGAISSIPFVGGQVAGLLTSAASGLGTIVGEMAAAAVAVNAVSVGAKAVVNQALSSETKSSLKALAPGRDAIAGETQKAVASFVQMAQDLPKTLAALPESQRPIAQKFLPIVATLQEGYAGELPGQKLSQAQLNLKQLTGAGAANKLDQSSLEAVRHEIVSQYKMASRALAELGQAMQGLSGAERTGMVADLKSQLSNRVKNLAKKAEYVGLRASDIKVEMPSNLPTVDVKSYESAGQDVGEGLSRGIESKIPEIVEINKQLFQEGYKAFQDEAEIQSPSKKMEYLGKMLAAGLIAGFDINSEDFAQAIREAMPDLPSLAANLPPIPAPKPWQFDKEYQAHLQQVEANKLDRLSQSQAFTPEEIPGMDEVNQLLSDAAENAKKLDKAMEAITPEYIAEGMKESAKSIDAELERIVNGVERVEEVTESTNPFTRLVDGAKDLAMTVAGGLGLVMLTGKLKDVAVESVQVYRNFEGIFIASKMVANGSQYLEKLRGQVRSLGGDLEATMRQGVQFAAGLQGTALEGSAQTMFLQADKSLKSIGLQTQQYDAAILAIKQVASKGRVSMEEISGQLGEAVPGALNLAAKAMGTNVQGFIQMVESGNLLSEEFLPKFLAQLEAQTAFLEPEIEKSLNAKMGKFGGNVTNLQVEIGARIAPNLAPLIDKAADAVDFLTQNLDKAVFAATTLAVALALPVANAGFAAMIASIQSGTAAMGIMTLTAKGLQIAMVGIGKAIVPLALAATIVGMVEGAFQALKGTSDGVEDSLKQVSVTADNIAKSYREATKAQAEFMAQASKPAQSSSWFLRGIDAVRERIGLGNYYGKAEEAANKEVFNESMNKIQGSLNLTGKVFDEQAMAGYINQASQLDSQIKAIQGRASALQLTDPMKNAESISQLREQASALIAEKKRLDDSFIPGGELGLEQTIADLERLKTTYQDLQATQGGDYSAQIAEIDTALGQVNKRLSIAKDINEQISNTLNRQRLAFIELNAEIAKRNQSLQISKNLTDANILARQARQEIGDKIVPQLQAQVELTYQEDMFSEFQRSVQKGRETLRQKLDPNVRAVLEELSGQSLEAIDIEGLTLIQEKLKTAGDRVKGTINDDILAELEKLANADMQMSETKRAIEQARVALMQSNRDLTDYYRDLGRQFQDFYLGLAEQQMSIEQQTEGFNRQLEDAQIQYVRENRQLQEDFSDLMDDLAMQLKQAQNQLKDTQAKIRQARFDREILEIDPGNNNSLGRRLAGIFQNLFKALDGNASESRNLETQLAQVQREYVNTMRRIRSIQEQQIDIERNRARQMRDLYLAEQQLLIAVQRAVIQLARQIEDFNIQVIRNLGNAGNAYRVGGQLNAPAIVRPGAPAINGRPITSGGGGSGGGGGGAGGESMSEAPRLKFGLTSSEMGGTETAGPIQWLQKQWEERVVKPAQRFMKDPVGSIQRRIDAISHTWGNMVKEPMQWQFHNQRGNLAHKYLIELMRRLGLSPEEINKTITQVMVEQLATGQKFGKIKIRGQNIPQQAFEEFVKNNGSLFISPNFRSQQRPSQPPRPANNIVPANRPTQRPSAPQPQIAAPLPVVVPQPPRRQDQLQRPTIAPAMTSGWTPTVLNFPRATGLAGSLRDTQISNIEAQQANLEEQRLLEIANAKEQLKQLQNEINGRIRQATREYESTTLAVRDLITGSKGYLTVQEEMNKAASDLREQFDSQIFSLRERLRSNAQEVEKINEYNDKLQERLDTQENLTEEEKESLQSLRAANVENIKAYQQENSLLTTTLATLEANKELSIQKRLQYEARQKENEIMNAQSQIAVSLVEAQYKAGRAGLINQAGIMRAVADAANALKQAQDLLGAEKIRPEDVEMVKEMNDLNIQESINNAIPGLNEFTQGLGEVIKGTKSWNDAMKDVLTSIADVVLQILVLAPLRNMLGRAIGDSLGLDEVATNAPSGGGFNIGGLFSGLFGGIGSLLGFPMGGKIPYYADGGVIGESFNKERALSGKQPRLVVAHDGEQVLSTLNGDAQLWRALKRTGRWDELKTPTRIPSYANGGSVGYSGGGSSGGRPMRGNTLVINQNYKITTPDADSFRKSKAQMAIEEANRTRRLTQRNG